MMLISFQHKSRIFPFAYNLRNSRPLKIYVSRVTWLMLNFLKSVKSVDKVTFMRSLINRL